MHPITAIKLVGTKDGVRIEAMTQSPRGTRVAFKSLSLATKKMDRKARDSALKLAIESLEQPSQ